MVVVEESSEEQLDESAVERLREEQLQAHQTAAADEFLSRIGEVCVYNNICVTYLPLSESFNQPPVHHLINHAYHCTHT